jgi:hypothetical protein
MSWLGPLLAGMLALTAPTAAAIVGQRSEALTPHAAAAVARQARHGERWAGEGSGRTGVWRHTTARDPLLGSHLLIHVPSSGIAAHGSPWRSSPVVGTVAGSSRYYHVPLVIWVQATNARGDWGEVELPYVWPRTEGWIPMAGLRHETTRITVTVDLSEHRIDVFRRGALMYKMSGATGAYSSPTPPGHYVVTDRVPFWPGSALGSFAFGISGIQPRLPAGWSGGDQLAIHGTNDPWSIGRSVSAGCVRVSESSLHHLEPLLRLGTPVVIRP